MLRELTIEHFAIIDQLRLQFTSGFTVLTGETGAGKSIIIDALQGVLGGKVVADMVQQGSRIAVVEAVFDWPERDAEVDELAEVYGVTSDDSLILRREIAATGRGVSRVNGRTVPVSVLAAFGSLLVDIHGQSDHVSVFRRDRQLDILDRYGGLTLQRREFSALYAQYIAARQRLRDLEQGQRSMEQRLDLLRFQTTEIDAARLREGEDDELLLERNLLTSGERRSIVTSAIYETLGGSAPSVVDRVGESASALRDLVALDNSLEAVAARLESVQYEIEDVAQEMRTYRDSVEFDPSRLEEIDERLDLFNRLKRKYGPTLADVQAFGEQSRLELEEVENIDDRLLQLRREVEILERSTGASAVALSGARTQAAETLADQMAGALRGLMLRGTDFRADVSREQDPRGLAMPDSPERVAVKQSGIDLVNFLVSFNSGEMLRPLERVASGGEMSRFLLALKTVLADADGTPTLIFDEVDTGVGGRSGSVVGDRLQFLAVNHQVISITHLPQVAALADTHLTVSKQVEDGRTGIRVHELVGQNRVTELADMMSGTATAAARRSAEELLEAAHGER